MEKEEIIDQLETFKHRLIKDVLAAYQSRGTEYGHERFSSWRRQITKFLDQNLPSAASKLDSKLHKIAFFRNRSESDADVFIREDGAPSEAFIDSLILDIRNNEYDSFLSKPAKPSVKEKSISNRRVFIVHGHDELTKTRVARFIEKIGLEAVILHEQASKGMTIIEKIEANTDVGFAIVLYTPDDKGSSNEGVSKGELKERARQNVVFEHGYLIAKLTRSRVVPLVSSTVELPSDISGMVYVDDVNWQIDIAKEMKAAGYEIDFNKIISG